MARILRQSRLNLSARGGDETLSDRLTAEQRKKCMSNIHSKDTGIEDNDMRQMAIYANRRGAKKMFLLYPLYRGAKPDNTEVIFNILDGPGDAAKKIPTQILQVPFSMCDDIDGTKRMLDSVLRKIIA